MFERSRAFAFCVSRIVNLRATSAVRRCGNQPERASSPVERDGGGRGVASPRGRRRSNVGNGRRAGLARRSRGASRARPRGPTNSTKAAGALASRGPAGPARPGTRRPSRSGGRTCGRRLATPEGRAAAVDENSFQARPPRTSCRPRGSRGGRGPVARLTRSTRRTGTTGCRGGRGPARRTRAARTRSRSRPSCGPPAPDAAGGAGGAGSHGCENSARRTLPRVAGLRPGPQSAQTGGTCSHSALGPHFSRTASSQRVASDSLHWSLKHRTFKQHSPARPHIARFRASRRASTNRDGARIKSRARRGAPDGVEGALRAARFETPRASKREMLRRPRRARSGRGAARA